MGDVGIKPKKAVQMIMRQYADYKEAAPWCSPSLRCQSGKLVEMRLESRTFDAKRGEHTGWCSPLSGYGC